jgi:hypothetical protein
MPSLFSAGQTFSLLAWAFKFVKNSDLEMSRIKCVFNI